MSISGSLSNALSGLSATARAAEVVSANVSNSLTDGYGRRELELASQTRGGNGAGVSVQGVYRAVDERVIGDRRLADASMGAAITTTRFFADLEAALGLPDDPGSLTGQFSLLEANLIEAASRPDSEARLNAVLIAAGSVSAKLVSISDKIQGIRQQTDSEIFQQVGALNEGLKQVSDLNNGIRTQLARGYDATALMDQRQQVIDGIAAVVPVKQVSRGMGQIALFTPGGAILLDGKPATIGFTPVGTVVPQMSVGGALSGLTINGLVAPAGSTGPMRGGSLSALFDIRDSHAVSAQTKLDALARDLIARFSNPAMDTTIAMGDPGLFTDAGSAFSVSAEVGLAGRISVNNLVDPASGGALWRLRDGLGALTSGDVGDATLLSAMIDTLGAPQIPASGGFIGAARTAIGLASDVLSNVNTQLRSAESEQSFATAKFDTLKTAELRNGVDTDREMQQLMLIEQAYSANARVVSTIDEMINTLLGM